ADARARRRAARRRRGTPRCAPACWRWRGGSIRWCCAGATERPQGPPSPLPAGDKETGGGPAFPRARLRSGLALLPEAARIAEAPERRAAGFGAPGLVRRKPADSEPRPAGVL